jgi:hypothetical protein
MSEFELRTKGEVESHGMSTFSYSPSFRLSDIPTKVWVIGGIVLSIILITSIFLIAFSFQYVEYNEYAFKKNTANNNVDSSATYTNGRYFWGINFTPFVFPRNYKTIYLTADGLGGLSIFAESGVTFTIECSFQYRLNPVSLSELFNKYGINYERQVVNVARSALKNIAPSFTGRQYYAERELISRMFAEALSTTLSTQSFVELGYFQLRKITLGAQLQAALVQSLVQDQINLEELFNQNATVIRRQTVTLQEETFANITRLRAEAAANSSFIVAQAETTAFQVKLQAKQRALNNLFNTLGFNTTEQRLAFLYATGIGDRTKIKGMTTKAITDLSSVLVSS